MKEVVSDGWIAARRCLEALEGCNDVESRLALWKAAKRYAEKARKEFRAGLAGEMASPAPIAAERRAGE